MQKELKINQNWLTRRTGDPFADTGGMVIQTLMKEWETTDILKLIEDTAKLYVNNWGGKLNAFFLNSKITQPAFQGPRKITETLSYYKGLLEETLPFEKGACRILGEQTKLFPAGRDNHIMSGSGTFINFHHAFQGGVMLSKEALIRVFFVPLGCVQLSDKIAILDSNNDELLEYFVRENVRENLRRISTKIGEGVLRSEFKNPSSALFEFAQNWIREAKDSDEVEHSELNLYHFTNFGASPEIILYNFSAALFQFYADLQYRTTQKDWRRFTNAYFRQKNAAYNYEADTFEIKEKNEVQVINHNSYKNWYNKIYEKLLKGDAIHWEMLNWVRNERRPLNFEIVKLYQKLLRNMNEKTLQIIERIADYVLQDSNNLKKKLSRLHKAGKSYEFKRALFKIFQDNHVNKNSAPLFTLQEYVHELFPETSYWQETKILLLIAIYQKMHEQKIWLDDEDIAELVEEAVEEEN